VRHQELPRVVLVHGNQEELVDNKRYELQRALLPNGEEDGEVVDVRSAGNQPLKLERHADSIIQELGTASFIPDQRRVVVVYDLQDFRTEQKGSRREARKSTKQKADPSERLEEYIRKVMLPDTNNAILFVFHEDDEKGRRVAPSSRLFQFVNSVGVVHAFTERRIDWRFEDSLLSGNLTESIVLLREWNDRGSGVNFRIVTTLNSFLQLLLQARLESDAKQQGRKTSAMFPKEMRPSLNSIPDFKARKYRALAPRVSLDRIRVALEYLNRAQKAYFPTGEELVVHSPLETLEMMLSELFARPARV